jgi:hypothetical protein
MFVRFDENYARFKGTLVELPPKGMPYDSQEQEPIHLGGGACKACDCRGFRKRKEDDGYCKCGHAYSQHEGWL